jgi:hypothetical protein
VLGDGGGPSEGGRAARKGGWVRGGERRSGPWGKEQAQEGERGGEQAGLLVWVCSSISFPFLFLFQHHSFYLNSNEI